MFTVLVFILSQNIFELVITVFGNPIHCELIELLFVFIKTFFIDIGTLFDGLLSQFPRALDYHDLMDALMMCWDEKFRTSLSDLIEKGKKVVLLKSIQK